MSACNHPSTLWFWRIKTSGREVYETDPWVITALYRFGRLVVAVISDDQDLQPLVCLPDSTRKSSSQDEFATVVRRDADSYKRLVDFCRPTNIAVTSCPFKQATLIALERPNPQVFPTRVD